MKRRTFLGGASIAAFGMAAAASAIPESDAVDAAGPAPPKEPPIDPAWPIIDAHHHLWDVPARAGRPANRYLLPDILADIVGSGHNITSTVFVECMTMYRAAGPAELRSLGETEFVNGIAAMSASGNYGPSRVAAGIVANIDMRLGDGVRPVLDAHRAIAGSRLKGVRNATAWDDFPVMGIALDHARFDWLLDPRVSKGLAVLGSEGLVFESWIFHTQLGQLSAVATENPNVTIILGHTGTPIMIGPYAGQQKAVFDLWRRGIIDLAHRPNVVVKLGGLGMSFMNPGWVSREPRLTSADIAQQWRPYIETCIEAFGPRRCMFESNFPPDRATCDYGTLWNVFKRIAAPYSENEKSALFSGTAARVFRLQSA